MNRSNRSRRNPKEALRRSQLLSMLGPGALIDLPKRAVLMAGLDHWVGTRDAVELDEPRLVAAVRRMTGETLKLKVPPTPEDEEDPKGVVAFQFPEVFVSQEPDPRELAQGRRSRRLIRVKQYEALKPREKQRYVPMRFVAACKNGHLQDVEWARVVHGKDPVCLPEELALVELGVAGDLADLSVRCLKCQRAVGLASLVAGGDKDTLGDEGDTQESADGEPTKGLGFCSGQRPWLGRKVASEGCVDLDDEHGRPCRLRLLVRHASNAYFPTTARVITIPAPPDPRGEMFARVGKLPEATRQMIANMGLASFVGMRAHMGLMLESVKDLDDETLFSTVKELEAGFSLESEVAWRDPKDEELAAFYAVHESLQRKITDKDFTAYAYPLNRLPDAVARVRGESIFVRDFIEKVVLVERLREVQALVGFTRIESPPELIRSEYDLNPRTAKVALFEKWRPAIEIRGEGIFVALDPKKVESWVEREAVQERLKRMREELLVSRYAKDKKGELTTSRLERVELPYVLVHTLAHLTLTAIALECGYSSSSIRERLYVPGEGADSEVDGVPRYGFLLYTGTTDSEGTMGGLVEVGRAITRHIAAGLELGALCSNDPICAQASHPMAVGGHIHGAACHGCVLVPESSCERRNELLDRRLVLKTVADGGGADGGLAFFRPTRGG